MSAQQISSSSSPSPTFFTSTSLPILCLIDWHSPKCREQHYQIPAPKFASAQFLPLSESNEDLNNEDGKLKNKFSIILLKHIPPDKHLNTPSYHILPYLSGKYFVKLGIHIWKICLIFKLKKFF